MRSIHHIILFSSILFLLLFTQPLHSSADIHLSQPSPVEVNLMETASEISAQFNVSRVEQSEDGTVWRIPGEGIIGRDGFPDLPAIGRWVRVSDRGEVQMTCTTEEQRSEGQRPQLYHAQVKDIRIDGTYSARGVYPESPVTISEPMIMRGVRMVMLSLYPVRWDADNEEYILTDRLDVSIETTADPGRNEVAAIPRQYSADFANAVDALLLNPPRRDEPEQMLPGGYLVVANEEAPESVQEFIDWKRRVGHPTELLTFDPDEVGRVELRDMIRDHYGDTGFEFLVFIGSMIGDADPGLEIPYDDVYYDIYFAQLEGEDMLPDVAVGTFNCLEEDNLTCALRRSISYQYEPYMEDTEWFTRAGVGVGACSVPGDLSPSYTGKWVAEVLSRNQFDDIETSFFADNGVDDPSRMIEELYNEQTNFITVRAHQWDLEVDNIEEGEVYPFHFLVSSGTISPPETGAFNWAFRQGTPDNMKGPSAGFGHRSSPRTNIANALIGGLIQSLFFLDIDSYGWARNYAVANLARVMPEDGVDLMPYYYSHWLYYGDPGQFVWRGVPEELFVAHDETIHPEATSLRINVFSDENGEEPVDGATVSLYQEDGINLTLVSIEGGSTFFTLDHEELNDNEIQVTVTGEDLLPTVGSISVEDDPIIVLTEYWVDDEENGNGDGIANSGETIAVILRLSNRTDEDWEGDITPYSYSPWIQDIGAILPDVQIPADESVEIPLHYRVSWNCPNETIANLGASGSDEEGLVFRVGVSIEVTGMQLDVSSFEIAGNPEPGEEIDLDVIIANIGDFDMPGADALLVSNSLFAEVTQPDGTYREIPAGEERAQVRDPFTVRFAEETVVGLIAEFNLVLRGDGRIIWSELPFTIQVGEVEVTDPLGPDSYGYIALDDGDNDLVWAEAPEYNWLDINAWHGDVEGELLEVEGEVNNDEVDATVLVELPFAFTYYGEQFNEISICTNGWIAVGDQTNLVNQQNWMFPGINGAYGMIAVFWDRLHDMDEDDGVFVYHDADNSKFIIQWEVYVEGNQRNGRNIFQIILYDADEYPTPTGDNQIQFQYHTVENIQDQWEANAHCSVGISSPDGMVGLTYSFWNDYSDAAARLQDERAILWTTVSYVVPAGSVFGQVLREIDDAPIEAATVRTSTGLRTVTDADGNYRIDNIESGTIDLMVSADRYEQIFVEEIEIEAEQEIERNFVMLHGWLNVEPDTLYFEADSIDPDERITVRPNWTFSNAGELECWFDLDEWEFAYHDSSDWPDSIGMWRDPQHEVRVGAGEEMNIRGIWQFGDGYQTGIYRADLLIPNSSPSPLDTLFVPIYLYVTVTSVQYPDNTLPTEFTLSPPYPNPFNSTSKVRFAVPGESDVSITLFDLSGRMVETIKKGEYSAGYYDATIDGKDLTTGLYFVKMEAGGFRSVQRLVLVK